jgi:hypothetical protein
VLVDEMDLIDEVGHRSHPEQSIRLPPLVAPLPHLH